MKGAVKEPLAIRIAQLKAYGGPGHSKAYQEIKHGRLIAHKMGRSTIITMENFKRYMASLPLIDPKAATKPRAYRQSRGLHRSQPK